MTVSKSNLFKTFSNNFYHLMCKNLASQRYTSLEFFLKSVSFKCKRANLEKNLKKRNLRNESQLRFFQETLKLILHVNPDRKKFFNFLATFSFGLGWRFRILNWVILDSLKQNHLLQVRYSYNYIPKPFSRIRFFFLKESNLIFHIFSNYNLFVSHCYNSQFHIYKKFVMVDFKYEVKEMLKNLESFNINHILIFSQKLLEIKKKYWYRNSEIFFWYIFSKFKSLFSLSPLISNRLSRKIREKINDLLVNSSDIEDVYRTQEIYLGHLAKKEKKTNSNKKKTSPDLFWKKRIHLPQKITKISRRKKILPRLLRPKKILKVVNNSTSKSNFPGFLSLKKVRKTKKMTDYFLNQLKYKEFVKIKVFHFKKIGFIYRKLPIDFWLYSEEQPGSFKSAKENDNFYLKWETIKRTGYVFFKLKELEVSFLCLIKIVNSNQKKPLRNSINLKTFDITPLKRISYFKFQSPDRVNLKKILNNYRFGFIFEIKINKTIGKFYRISKFIKKFKNYISNNYKFDQSSEKETLSFRIFDNLTKKLYIKKYFYSFDLIKIFFLINKLFYIYETLYFLNIYNKLKFDII